MITITNRKETFTVDEKELKKDKIQVPKSFEKSLKIFNNII